VTSLQILFSLLPGKMGFVMWCGWKFNTFNYTLNRGHKDKSWFCFAFKAKSHWFLPFVLP